MDLQIRKMKPEESKEIKSIGRKAFKGFEKLTIPKPKKAMVAELNGEIVGAILYKILKVKDLKIGYVKFAFIDPKAQGKGVGKRLYQESINHLYNLGCDYVGAIVKDDNVASWGLFLKFNIKRISILGMIKELGLYATLRTIFSTPFFVAVGMEYYLGAKDKTIETDKQNNSWQILAYLLINLVFFIAIAFRFENFLIAILAMLCILVGSVFSGFLGTLFSRRRFHFRLNDGGFIVTLITNLTGGILPLIGNWYPDKYEKSNNFKRALGIVALFKWLFLIAVAWSGFFITDLPVIVEVMTFIASNLLVFYMLPFYPFESFAGGRVWQWNKLCFVAMVALSIGTFFW
jgi:GNAT superfamily N-acetyltransferase